MSFVEMTAAVVLGLCIFHGIARLREWWRRIWIMRQIAQGKYPRRTP